MTEDRWLWRSVMALTLVALAGALALIVALALGWNSPGPSHPPDWRAAGLPLDLEAASGETAVMLLGHPSGDFTLEVEATPLSGPGSGFNGYGLVYRAQDAAHYYALVVGSDGYYSVLQVAEADETPLVEWQQFPHIHRGGQTNRLRVICAGPICHFTINDEYVTAVEDATWLTGDTGLWVRSFGDKDVAVRFSIFRTWTAR